MNSPVTSVTGLGHLDEQSSLDSSFGGKLVAKQFGTFSTAGHLQQHRRTLNSNPSLAIEGAAAGSILLSPSEPSPGPT